MNETPYFYFIVLAEPQPWPYFIEVPYAAWPDEEMYYNSNGDCQQLYDREWSFLDVMNWETHENLIIWNAGWFQQDRAEQTRHKMEEAVSWGDDLLSPAPIGRLGLFLLDIIPGEYRKTGNVVIASFQCHKVELPASVTRLFMQQLKSNMVWDGQTNSITPLPQLVNSYLGGFPLKKSDTLTSEAQRLFFGIEAWHRTHPNHRLGFLKTLAQTREFLESIDPVSEGGA